MGSEILRLRAAPAQNDRCCLFACKLHPHLHLVNSVVCQYIIPMDCATHLGAVTLKNPLICASSEFTMTAAGIKAALDSGAAAVVAKSVNESPQAAGQLDSAEYVLLAQN